MELSSGQRAVLTYLARRDVTSASYPELDQLVRGPVQVTLNSLRRRGLIESDFHTTKSKPHSITLAGKAALS